MHRFSQTKKNRILFFFICFQCFLIIYCGCFCGKEFRGLIGKNLTLRFYNGVLELYMPQIMQDGDAYRSRLQNSICSLVCPSMEYNEQCLAVMWQEDEQVDYEKMAIEENVQLEHMMIENSEQKEIAEASNLLENSMTSSGEAEWKAKNKQEKINLKKLEDFDYLRQNFYQVDNTTTIGKEQLDVHKLLGVDMSVDTTAEGPVILIYHTHSQEGYCDSKAGDENKSVLALGDELEKYLEKEGFSVLHHKEKYDVGDRDHAYSNAAPALEKLLKKYPSIQVVIDLHRDGVPETTRLVTDINGKKTAQIMFFNGLSRTTTQGNITSLPNPYIEENLALSFQLELAAKEYYPNFARKTYLKGYRYNMHMCPKSILVEVGAQTNTYQEAKNAMRPLADILCKVLKKETE